MTIPRKYPDYEYTDIIFEIKGKIGIIKLNRPKSLNSFGGRLLIDLAIALRELNEHPDTVFTVITGEGRFFSAGADVKAVNPAATTEYASAVEKKIAFLESKSTNIEIVRSMIDHRKVLVLALNGPAVGAAAAYFPAFADIVLAAETAYLQAPFSRLGLVPEFGSITGYAHSVGVHRATEFFTFGRRLSAEELQHWGMVNRLFPAENFHQKVLEFLEEQLSVNDGTSMMEAKRLQNLAFRRDRLLAVYEAADALGERVAEGAHTKRFEEQNRKQAAKSRSGSKL